MPQGNEPEFSSLHDYTGARAKPSSSSNSCGGCGVVDFVFAEDPVPAASYLACEIEFNADEPTELV